MNVNSHVYVYSHSNITLINMYMIVYVHICVSYVMCKGKPLEAPAKKSVHIIYSSTNPKDKEHMFCRLTASTFVGDPAMDHSAVSPFIGSCLH